MRKQIALIMCFLILGVLFAAADPVGSELTTPRSSRRAGQQPSSIVAEAGNVSTVNINQTKVTDIWQGFYGNVTGTITLDNANNRTFYDWAITSVTGEVYAANATIASWSAPTCAAQNFIYGEEASLGLTTSWVDSINNTFRLISHPAFSTGTTPLTNCRSTQAYNSTRSGEYWNALLNVSNTMVYVSILKNDANGFDSNTADFELLVPTNYATRLRTYFFYVELA